jgi:primase-polymerase (primpol)-like protein
MGTRFEVRKDGKLNKPTHRVRRGERVIQASKTDPDSLASFEEAVEAYERREVDAIGFVFSEDDPFSSWWTWTGS